MAVETKTRFYKAEDPLSSSCYAPFNWESIPSENGVSLSDNNNNNPLHNTPIVSESSLIQLAINALQGTESALLAIEKLCITFDSDPADRTFLRIPSIWNRTTSTLALGKILKSIGCSGFLVFLLREFVDHFEHLHFNTSIVPEEDENDSEAKAEKPNPQSLVNHAFSVAVRKLLEGCIAAVDTLYASVKLRRSSQTVDMSTSTSFRVGCLTRSHYSEVTLLEVYLHSKELRTKIEVVGNICQIRDIAFSFSGPCLKDLVHKAKSGFCYFPRSGDLLTYLYSCLKVADPAHNALLKFLFLRSCGPYSEFIRSWIYKAEISDPYKEFMVDYSRNLPHFSSSEDVSSSSIWLADIKERDGVTVPCFLKEMCIPIFRAGQQLQVLMKLFESSGHINNENITYSDILPCWTVFSNDHSSNASPFSFERESIEAMALARRSYYRKMMEKMDIIMKILRTRFQQVENDSNVSGKCETPKKVIEADGTMETPKKVAKRTKQVAHKTCTPVVSHGTIAPYRGHCRGSQEVPFSPTIDEMDVDLIVDTSDSEASTNDELLPFLEDQLASSECSSLDGLEEQNESLQSLQFPSGYGQNVLSPLELLSNSFNENSFHVTNTSNTFNPGKVDSSKYYEQIDKNDLSSHTCLRDTNLLRFETHSSSDLCDNGFLFSGSVKNPFSVEKMVRHDATSLPLESGLGESLPYLSRTMLMELSSPNEAIDNDHPLRNCRPSTLFSLSNLNFKCDSNPLSMNPLLFKSDLLRKSEKRLCADPPSFDFSSIKDPCKIHHPIAETTIHKDPNAYAAIGSSNFQKDYGYDGHETVREKNDISHVNITSVSETYKKEDINLANVHGGGGWESMLSCLSNTMEKSAKVCSKSSAATFEMPLDIVIEKCLVQEILLQYWYISKLTIKVLEDGFNLRDHLSALRRYHFMEVADWADLFIVSLRNRKWEAMEVDRTVLEIQGLLAICLQKSSCEKDDYKDRLFVYLKGYEKNMVPSLVPKIEVDSFNFMYLGYKVDWPISIVVTPGALDIYAEIFRFLLRVKLAIFSLTDTWCAMKDLLKLAQKNFNRQNIIAKTGKLGTQGPRSEVKHLNTLTIVRHQINHFVTTLQQYVQSQLSHVSCCSYTDSLNTKAKDMMDLQSVHMAFLTDSLHICFLSDEMKVVSSIIRSILQCALDLQACLVESKGNSQIREGSPDKFYSIDISQVLAVKKAFKRNITDLHTCFLKAPKQREFGLTHFWGFLNYNEYYSGFSENRNYHGFPL